MNSEKILEIFCKICICFVCKSYYRTRRLGLVRGSDFLEKIHQICWFSGCDFHLPVKKSSAIYAFWTNSGDFSAAAAAAAAATSEKVWVVRSFTIRERISSAWRMSWSSAKAVCPRRRRRRRRGRRCRRRRNDE